MSIRKRNWKTRRGEDREAYVVDYFDQGGTRRLKTFERKKDAVAFETTMRGEVREGTHVPERATITVKEAGENWIETCKAAGLERSTLDQYAQHLALHIAPFIGARKLSQVSVATVREFQDKLRNEGRSDAMVKSVTTSLGSILADAQERGQASRNPVREITKQARGKARRAQKRRKARLQVGVDIPTPAEVRAILDAAKGRWRPFLITAVFTGLRASELRGLFWEDVDLKAARIHVRRRADKYNEIGMPKSDAGQRTIPVPPIVVNGLREWKLACPKGELDLVFPNGAGNIEAHSNIVHRGYGPTQIAAGVTRSEVGEEGQPVLVAKYPGLHALRHFFASWCINRREDGGLNLPPKAVQERMGHSSIMVTMDVYGHLFPSADDAELLADAEARLMSAVAAT